MECLEPMEVYILMGFLKKIFFSKDKKTKIEKKVEENAERYSNALIENQVICNGCGQNIIGTPKIKKHNGKIMYFHKRCWKAMCKGRLPKPI